MRQHAEEHLLFLFFFIDYSLALVKQELTNELKPTTVTGIQKQAFKKKAPSSSCLFFFLPFA